MEPSPPLISKTQRVVSIDVLRGLVMIIMALDHVRDFFHAAATQFDPLDLQRTSIAIFLTRWITHYCAPTFVFLSGASAFLTLERKGKKGLSRFLFTRGLWLVIVEVTLINFSINFLHCFSLLLLQVIWALGISMIALSVLIYLPKRVLLAVALIIIAGHNVLDNITVAGNGIEAVAWSLLHQPNFFTFGRFQLLVAYPVLPWIGVMAAGYCFGELYTARFTAAERKKILVILGFLCIVFFIILRFTNIYGDSSLWSPQRSTIFTILSFIRTTKYPPSLLYILMTLGPAILFLALAEKPLLGVTKVLSVYGRVPMFYYIGHLYLIRLSHILLGILSGHSLKQVLSMTMLQQVPGFGFRLVIVYLIWISIVVVLYPFCKRYDRYKMANRQKWWLSYL